LQATREAIVGECPRESELLEALQTTAWPDSCSADLRTHVSECQSCTELAAIVLPLLDEHRTATLEAPVPSSAVVWWRAQRRARLEAARVAARPITVLQGLSGACAAGLMAGAVGYVSPAVRAVMLQTWSTVKGITSPDAVALPPIPWTDLLVSPIAVAAAVSLTMALVLAPLVIYLSGSDS
jgi:hypothetical protein